MKRTNLSIALAGCVCLSLGSVTVLADSHGKGTMKLAEEK